MHQNLWDFETFLEKSYNLEESDGAGWYRFSKGRGVYRAGQRGELFRLEQELFTFDTSSQEFLEKDLKKAGKSLGQCAVEAFDGSLWLVMSVPLEQADIPTIKEMLDTCSIASRSRAVKKLETQHRYTITLHKPR